MAEPNWKPMKASPEKFLKAENYLTKPFLGVLDAIYPSETQDGKPLVRLDFEGGSSLSLFGMEYRNEDGTYPFGLGAFIKSAEALGLEVQEAEEDGIVKGIRLIEGDKVLEKPKIWIRGIEEKGKVGETATPSYFKWGILEKYEVTASTPKPKGRPPIAKSKPALAQPDITGIVLDALLEPHRIGELFTAFGKKYKVSELRAALEVLKAQGVVVESGGKYQVV